MLNKKEKRNYDLFCKFIRAVFHIVHFISVKNPFQAFFSSGGSLVKLTYPFFFQSMLSHRYGYRNLPRVIEASEFEKLVEVVDPDSKKVLLR